MPSRALGNVRTYAVRTPNDLPTDLIFGENIPLCHDIPIGIRQFFRKFIHPKIFKIGSAHNLEATNS